MLPAGAAGEEAALIDQINSVVARINAKTAELQNGIDGKLKWLPGPLQDRVVSGWNEFVGFLKECWNALAEIVTNLGSPSTLWATADAWSDRVGRPVSGQVQVAEAGSLTVDDNWNGAAADAYRQNLPRQKVALEKMKSTLCDGISTALSDLANGICIFLGALVVALLALVGGIVGALLSSATIFGLPAAPFIAAGAALVAVGAFLSAGLHLRSTAATVNSALRQRLADDSGYLGGHWPPATTG